jgi:hypothetical protein
MGGGQAERYARWAASIQRRATRGIHGTRDVQGGQGVDGNATEMGPADLDGWLREMLGRRLVVVGLALAAEDAGQDAATAALGEPPQALIAALERYTEIWVRWLAAGMAVDAAVAHATVREADVLLVWVPISTGEQMAAAHGEPRQEPVLARLLAQAEARELRDPCVLLLVGPGASRPLARRLGYDDGFGPEAPVAQIATAAARETLAREEFRRKGSSPPCYL